MDLALGVHMGLPIGSAAALSRRRAIPTLMVGRTGQSSRGAIEAGMLLRPRTVLSKDENVQDELGHALRITGGLSSLGPKLRGERPSPPWCRSSARGSPLRCSVEPAGP